MLLSPCAYLRICITHVCVALHVSVYVCVSRWMCVYLACLWHAIFLYLYPHLYLRPFVSGVHLCVVQGVRAASNSKNNYVLPGPLGLLKDSNSEFVFLEAIEQIKVGGPTTRRDGVQHARYARVCTANPT